MKKYLIVVLIIFMIILSGCTKKVEENYALKTTNAESQIRQLGNTTDEFNHIDWAGFENTYLNASFEELEIKGIKDGDSIVDAYTRENTIYIAVENKSGEVSYNTLNKGKLSLIPSREEAIDEGVFSKLEEKDEYWGFKRLGEYLAVIKADGTEVYKNNTKLFHFDGVAAFSDIDDNGTMEIVCRNSEGNMVTIFALEDEKLVEIWRYDISGESFHGDIQIGDLNHDGLKEIYLDKVSSGTQKFILTSDGFSQDFNLPVDKAGYENGSYFILDINEDDSMDIIIQSRNYKPLIFIQK